MVLEKGVSFEEAVILLKNENVVALPTETVYGLAARYDSQKGIESLYRLKGRPKQKPLTVNLCAAAEIKKYITYEPKGLSLLMQSYWPGPLTLVLEIKEEAILPIVRNGGKMCGFRVPDHDLTRAVIKEVGPIVLPSANLSGNIPPVESVDVEREFGDKVSILDGGKCKIGIESTVLIFIEERWRVLREGAVSENALKTILKY